jgi:hypothetical protein
VFSHMNKKRGKDKLTLQGNNYNAELWNPNWAKQVLKTEWA